MKNAIVITTINSPTSAIVEYSGIEDASVIVVGDRKTPMNWAAENVTYISLDHQKTQYSTFSKYLPENHYCRKMIGYLHAINQGAETIIDTDDDNHPYPNWRIPDEICDAPSTNDNMGFVNVYSYYSEKRVWPRGFPLMKIRDARCHITNSDLVQKVNNIGIWQGLADKDPDVDAIYRLTDDSPVIFNKMGPIVLGEGTICPINSQNTVFRKAMFPLLYLPCTVSFRFTDILRGLIAQPIAWKHGYRIGFTDATVYQDRNPHDYFKDFESEISCYRYCHMIPSIVSDCIGDDGNIFDDIYSAYVELEKRAIVGCKELQLLDNWINDLRGNI